MDQTVITTKKSVPYQQQKVYIMRYRETEKGKEANRRSVRNHYQRNAEDIKAITRDKYQEIKDVKKQKSLERYYQNQEKCKAQALARYYAKKGTST